MLSDEPPRSTAAIRLDNFSEDFKIVGIESVSDPVAAAVAELANAGYEVDILEAPSTGVLRTPVLRLTLRVSLPSRPVHGIEQEERILVGSWETYPASAPSVRFDRVDFPRGLPHINQTRKSSPVWPCLTAQPLSSWFQGRTILDLIRQVERWLSDAASGRLMLGDERTFEPIFISPDREYFVDDEVRIGPSGYCVVAASSIVEQVEQVSGSREYVGSLKARYLPLHPRGRPYPPVVSLDRVLGTDESWSSEPNRFDFFGAIRSGTHTTPILPGLVVLLHETDVHVGPPPDEFATFVAWCREMGGEDSLEGDVAQCFAAWHAVDLVPITLLIPRPRPLAGNPSGVWNLDCVSVIFDRGGSGIPCLNLAPLTHQAVAQYSGSDRQLPRTLMVGAGTFGSKLATQLVRTAVAAMDVVDPDVLLEHNLARHDLRRVHVGLSKAEALMDELSRLVTDFQGMAYSTTIQEALRTGTIAPSDYGLVLDATASPGMPWVLSYFEDLPRVFSAFAVPGGALAIATIEGPERNPRADDLEAALYAQADSREDVHNWLKTPPYQDHMPIGGCRDVTAVIADDTASLHVARFSALLRTGALEIQEGAIWFHSEDGNFSYLPVGPTDVVEKGGWSVRIGASVRETVVRMLDENKRQEVAGYLHGLRDRYRKEILVSHASVEPLLIQSESGVEIDTSRYQNPAAGTLDYLGSWHTHPKGSTDTSERDERTASQLTSLSELTKPLLFLVAGPAGLAVHLRE